jgi:hypothetical protein
MNLIDKLYDPRCVDHIRRIQYELEESKFVYYVMICHYYPCLHRNGRGWILDPRHEIQEKLNEYEF